MIRPAHASTLQPCRRGGTSTCLCHPAPSQGAVFLNPLSSSNALHSHGARRPSHAAAAPSVLPLARPRNPPAPSPRPAAHQTLLGGCVCPWSRHGVKAGPTRSPPLSLPPPLGFIPFAPRPPLHRTPASSSLALGPAPSLRALPPRLWPPLMPCLEGISQRAGCSAPKPGCAARFRLALSSRVQTHLRLRCAIVGCGRAARPLACAPPCLPISLRARPQPHPPHTHTQTCCIPLALHWSAPHRRPHTFAAPFVHEPPRHPLRAPASIPIRDPAPRHGPWPNLIQRPSLWPAGRAQSAAAAFTTHSAPAGSCRRALPSRLHLQLAIRALANGGGGMPRQARPKLAPAWPSRLPVESVPAPHPQPPGLHRTLAGLGHVPTYALSLAVKGLHSSGGRSRQCRAAQAGWGPQQGAGMQTRDLGRRVPLPHEPEPGGRGHCRGRAGIPVAVLVAVVDGRKGRAAD
jgi:hypothetical protein